jgi:hypothetical protein
MQMLKKKRVNVNGSRDNELGDSGGADASAEHDGGAADGDVGSEHESDEDDSDDESADEDFAPSEGSEPDEEYDSEDGKEINMDEEVTRDEDESDGEEEDGEYGTMNNDTGSSSACAADAHEGHNGEMEPGPKRAKMDAENVTNMGGLPK